MYQGRLEAIRIWDATSVEAGRARQFSAADSGTEEVREESRVLIEVAELLKKETLKHLPLGRQSVLQACSSNLTAWLG